MCWRHGTRPVRDVPISGVAGAIGPIVHVLRFWRRDECAPLRRFSNVLGPGTVIRHPSLAVYVCTRPLAVAPSRTSHIRWISVGNRDKKIE